MVAASKAIASKRPAKSQERPQAVLSSRSVNAKSPSRASSKAKSDATSSSSSSSSSPPASAGAVDGSTLRDEDKENSGKQVQLLYDMVLECVKGSGSTVELRYFEKSRPGAPGSTQEALNRRLELVEKCMVMGEDGENIFDLDACVRLSKKEFLIDEAKNFKFPRSAGPYLAGLTYEEWWSSEEALLLMKLFLAGPYAELVEALESTLKALQGRRQEAFLDNKGAPDFSRLNQAMRNQREIEIENMLDIEANKAQFPCGLLRYVQVLYLRNLYSGKWNNAELSLLDEFGVCMRACTGAGKLGAALLQSLLPANYIRASSSLLQKANYVDTDFASLADLVRASRKLAAPQPGPSKAFLRDGNLVTERSIIASAFSKSISNFKESFSTVNQTLTASQIQSILDSQNGGTLVGREPENIGKLIHRNWKVTVEKNGRSTCATLDKCKVVAKGFSGETIRIIATLPNILKKINFRGHPLSGLDAFYIHFLKPDTSLNGDEHETPKSAASWMVALGSVQGFKLETSILNFPGFEVSMAHFDEELGIDTKQSATQSKALLSHIRKTTFQFWFSATTALFHYYNNAFSTVNFRDCVKFKYHNPEFLCSEGNKCTLCSIQWDEYPNGYSLADAVRDGAISSLWILRTDGHESVKLDAWFHLCMNVLNLAFSGQRLDQVDTSRTQNDDSSSSPSPQTLQQGHRNGQLQQLCFKWVKRRALFHLRDSNQISFLINLIMKLKNALRLGGTKIVFGALMPGQICDVVRFSKKNSKYVRETMPSDEAMLQSFQKGKVNVLFVVNFLDRAYSDPGLAASCMQAASSTDAKSEQREGRLRRTFPNDMDDYLLSVKEMQKLQPNVAKEYLAKEREKVHNYTRIWSTKLALVPHQRFDRIKRKSDFIFGDQHTGKRSWSLKKGLVDEFFEPSTSTTSAASGNRRTFKVPDLIKAIEATRKKPPAPIPECTIHYVAREPEQIPVGPVSDSVDVEMHDSAEHEDSVDDLDRNEAEGSKQKSGEENNPVRNDEVVEPTQFTEIESVEPTQFTESESVEPTQFMNGETSPAGEEQKEINENDDIDQDKGQTKKNTSRKMSIETHAAHLSKKNIADTSIENPTLHRKKVAKKAGMQIVEEKSVEDTSADTSRGNPALLSKSPAPRIVRRTRLSMNRQEAILEEGAVDSLVMLVGDNTASSVTASVQPSVAPPAQQEVAGKKITAANSSTSSSTPSNRATPKQLREDKAQQVLQAKSIVDEEIDSLRKGSLNESAATKSTDFFMERLNSKRSKRNSKSSSSAVDHLQESHGGLVAKISMRQSENPKMLSSRRRQSESSRPTEPNETSSLLEKTSSSSSSLPGDAPPHQPKSSSISTKAKEKGSQTLRKGRSSESEPSTNTKKSKSNDKAPGEPAELDIAAVPNKKSKSKEKAVEEAVEPKEAENVAQSKKTGRKKPADDPKEVVHATQSKKCGPKEKVMEESVASTPSKKSSNTGKSAKEPVVSTSSKEYKTGKSKEKKVMGESVSSTPSKKSSNTGKSAKKPVASTPSKESNKKGKSAKEPVVSTPSKESKKGEPKEKEVMGESVSSTPSKKSSNTGKSAKKPVASTPSKESNNEGKSAKESVTSQPAKDSRPEEEAAEEPEAPAPSKESNSKEKVVEESKTAEEADDSNDVNLDDRYEDGTPDDTQVNHDPRLLEVNEIPIKNEVEVRAQHCPQGRSRATQLQRMVVDDSTQDEDADGQQLGQQGSRVRVKPEPHLESEASTMSNRNSQTSSDGVAIQADFLESSSQESLSASSNMVQSAAVSSEVTQTVEDVTQDTMKFLAKIEDDLPSQNGSKSQTGKSSSSSSSSSSTEDIQKVQEQRKKSALTGPTAGPKSRLGANKIPDEFRIVNFLKLNQTFNYETFFNRLSNLPPSKVEEEVNRMIEIRSIKSNKDGKPMRCECGTILLAYDGQSSCSFHAYGLTGLAMATCRSKITPEVQRLLSSAQVLGKGKSKCVSCVHQSSRVSRLDPNKGIIKSGDITLNSSGRVTAGSLAGAMSATVHAVSQACVCSGEASKGKCAGPFQNYEQGNGDQPVNLCSAHAVCMACVEEKGEDGGKLDNLDNLPCVYFSPDGSVQVYCKEHNKCSQCGEQCKPYEIVSCDYCEASVCAKCSQHSYFRVVPGPGVEIDCCPKCLSCIHCSSCFNSPEEVACFVDNPSLSKEHALISDYPLMLCHEHSRCSFKGCTDVGTERCNMCSTVDAERNGHTDANSIWLCSTHFHGKKKTEETPDEKNRCEKCNILSLLVCDKQNYPLLGSILAELEFKKDETSPGECYSFLDSAFQALYLYVHDDHVDRDVVKKKPAGYNDQRSYQNIRSTFDSLLSSSLLAMMFDMKVRGMNLKWDPIELLWARLEQVLPFSYSLSGSKGNIADDHASEQSSSRPQRKSAGLARAMIEKCRDERIEQFHLLSPMKTLRTALKAQVSNNVPLAQHLGTIIAPVLTEHGRWTKFVLQEKRGKSTDIALSRSNRILPFKGISRGEAPSTPAGKKRSLDKDKAPMSQNKRQQSASKSMSVSNDSNVEEDPYSAHRPVINKALRHKYLYGIEIEPIENSSINVINLLSSDEESDSEEDQPVSSQKSSESGKRRASAPTTNSPALKRKRVQASRRS